MKHQTQLSKSPWLLNLHSRGRRSASPPSGAAAGLLRQLTCFCISGATVSTIYDKLARMWVNMEPESTFKPPILSTSQVYWLFVLLTCL